jgi:hypothetical protein
MSAEEGEQLNTVLLFTGGIRIKMGTILKKITVPLGMSY